jgi:hypothetical protein
MTIQQTLRSRAERESDESLRELLLSAAAHIDEAPRWRDRMRESDKAREQAEVRERQVSAERDRWKREATILRRALPNPSSQHCSWRMRK